MNLKNLPLSQAFLISKSPSHALYVHVTPLYNFSTNFHHMSTSNYLSEGSMELVVDAHQFSLYKIIGGATQRLLLVQTLLQKHTNALRFAANNPINSSVEDSKLRSSLLFKQIYGRNCVLGCKEPCEMLRKQICCVFIIRGMQIPFQY